jgi:hypothetical protein
VSTEITAAAESITDEILAAVVANFSQCQHMVWMHRDQILNMFLLKQETPNCYVFYDTKFIDVSAVHQ